VKPNSQRSLESRVVTAAEKALARQGFVTPVDVCLGLGWLQDCNVDDWRHGRADDLEDFLPVHDNRLIDIHVHLYNWATGHGLQRTEAEYISATRSRRQLRFLRDGHPLEEAAWRMRWISPDLEDRKRERITKTQDAPPDLLVIQPIKDWSCAECRATGDLLIMDVSGPLCLGCADLDHLVFLPAGDAALTRRAKKASGLSAVVVRWSRTRKRYERQGLLVEEPALEQAEQQCLADEEARRPHPHLLGPAGLAISPGQADRITGPSGPGPDQPPECRWAPSRRPTAHTDTSADPGRGEAAGGLR
jgi:hypothetical protein